MDCLFCFFLVHACAHHLVRCWNTCWLLTIAKCLLLLIIFFEFLMKNMNMFWFWDQLAVWIPTTTPGCTGHRLLWLLDCYWRRSRTTCLISTGRTRVPEPWVFSCPTNCKGNVRTFWRVLIQGWCVQFSWLTKRGKYWVQRSLEVIVSCFGANIWVLLCFLSGDNWIRSGATGRCVPL